MKVKKGSIYREIDGRRLEEYRGKGFVPCEEPAGEPPIGGDSAGGAPTPPAETKGKKG